MSKHFWRGFFSVFIPAMAALASLESVTFGVLVLFNYPGVEWHHVAAMTSAAVLLWTAYLIDKKGNP